MTDKQNDFYYPRKPRPREEYQAMLDRDLLYARARERGMVVVLGIGFVILVAVVCLAHG